VGVVTVENGQATVATDNVRTSPSGFMMDAGRISFVTDPPFSLRSESDDPRRLGV
jgi:hypothetical protein